MQRFKYILVVTLLVIVIGACVILGMLLNASAETEKKYQNTISEMEKGNWNNALKIVNEIPNYKNSSVLSIYIYPHTLYYSKYDNDSDALRGYTQAVNYIKEHNKEITGEGNSKYSKQISELEKTLNFKISELKAKSDNQNLMAELNAGVEYIKEGNYTAAEQKLSLLNNSELSNEKLQLLEYINLLNAIKANNNSDIYAAIGKLDPNYTGDLSNEIKTSVQAYADINKWNTMYKPGNDKNSGSNISVAVGDQKETVIQNLGSPVKQNIITNSYGTFEELVFSNNKLVYLENNIVTVVKG